MGSRFQGEWSPVDISAMVFISVVPLTLLDAANEGGPNSLYDFGAGVLSFSSGAVEDAD